MDPLDIHKLLKGKTFIVNFRMNNKLAKILNEFIEKDNSYDKRPDWFDEKVINYIKERNGFDSIE